MWGTAPGVSSKESPEQNTNKINNINIEAEEISKCTEQQITKCVTTNHQMVSTVSQASHIQITNK
jgi:hypothetical protein